jgi:hypothetical protein
VSEDDLLTAVLDLARLFGLKVAHFRPAKTDRGWRTAVQGDGKGYPDLTIAGPGGALFVELKSATGRPSREQQEWLAMLNRAGAGTAIWRPADLRSGRIKQELRALRTPQVRPQDRREQERQETM